jgi:predicted transcriptional regulator
MLEPLIKTKRTYNKEPVQVVIFDSYALDGLLELSGNAIKVLSAILKWGLDNKKVTFLYSITKASYYSGLSQATAHKAIQELIQKGYIYRHTDYIKKEGDFKSYSRYTIKRVILG